MPAGVVEKIEPLSSAYLHVMAEGVSIMARQAQIESQYQSLMLLTRERQRKTSETYKAYVLNDELVQFSISIKNNVRFVVFFI